MNRIPTRPVTKWPRKQLVRYAVCAIDRDTMNGTEGAQAVSDAMNAGTVTREQLRHWASREVEWRMLNGE